MEDTRDGIAMSWETNNLHANAVHYKRPQVVNASNTTRKCKQYKLMGRL